MASHISFVISGLLLVIFTIVVQSIPIGKAKEIVQVPSINNKPTILKTLLKSDDSEKTSSISTSTTTTTVTQSSLPTSTITQENNNKKKRFIDDDQLDEFLDNESDESNEEKSYQVPYSKLDNNNDKIDHTLHAKTHETAAKIHDNTDKVLNTDDSKIFSDIKMTPSQLTNILRRRRDVKLNDEINRRRKRALSPYDFYDTDSLYDPYVDIIEQQQYARPVRSFAPLYWYPSAYERNIRSALTPSNYESSEYPILYSTNINNDEINENSDSILDDDENDYDSNRYPILLQSSNNPFDNLQLQQQYNTDELPIDEDIEQTLNDDDNDDGDDNDDDDDEQYRVVYEKERPYYTRYGPIETYF